jgi:hypothetical protein
MVVYSGSRLSVASSTQSEAQRDKRQPRLLALDTSIASSLPALLTRPCSRHTQCLACEVGLATLGALATSVRRNSSKLFLITGPDSKELFTTSTLLSLGAAGAVL